MSDGEHAPKPGKGERFMRFVETKSLIGAAALTGAALVLPAAYGAIAAGVASIEMVQWAGARTFKDKMKSHTAHSAAKSKH